MLSTTGLVNFRNQNSTAGYQGDYAEKEKIGSTNAFELRLYDARIGRWMTTDPAGEFVSPYIAMGNMPTIAVDPDGADIIFFMYSSTTNSYEPILTIRTKNFKNEFYVPGEHFNHDPFTNSPQPLPDITLTSMIDNHPNLSAIGIEWEGSITTVLGKSNYLSMVAFLKGPDKNKIFLYGSDSYNAGLDISNTIALKKYYAKNDEKFTRRTLVGDEIGIEAGGEIGGRGLFFGLDNYFNIPYAGDHIFLGASIGPGKAYKSDTSLLFEVTEDQNLTPDYYKH